MLLELLELASFSWGASSIPWDISQQTQPYRIYHCPSVLLTELATAIHVSPPWRVDLVEDHLRLCANNRVDDMHPIMTASEHGDHDHIMVELKQ